MTRNYRPDIDGLRAIAVLAVIFDHAGFSAFSGGYIGVDVFFVISGYLITKIILNEISQGAFSLKKFYERRIRRIFPALYMMLFATTLTSVVFFDSDRLTIFAESLRANAGFVSNIYFWSQAGYFDAPSALKPLLHTWSLAVEEQFYIFLPLFLRVAVRQPSNTLMRLLALSAVGSFGICIYYMGKDPSGAFYLAPMRAWELLVGSILAYAKAFEAKKTFFQNALGLFGLGMIVVSVFAYSENTPFPGIMATLPVFGTALVINSGVKEEALTRQVLSFPPLAFVGKISYSLYLWHWPMLVFTKYYSLLELSISHVLWVLTGLFLVATLSWRFVETPFRTPKPNRSTVVFWTAGLIAILTAIIAQSILSEKGFPGRYLSTPPIPHPDLIASWAPNGPCETDVDQQDFTPIFCSLGASDQRPSFLLWGDSHALSIAPGVHLAAERAGLTGVGVTSSGCHPLLGVLRNDKQKCFEFNAGIIEFLNEHPEISTVILSSRWALAATGTRTGIERGEQIILLNPDTGLPLGETNETAFRYSFHLTISTLLEMGKRVVVVGEIPEIGYPVGAYFEIAQRTHRDLNELIAPSVEDYFLRNQIVMDTIARETQNDKIQVLEPWRVLCAEGKCLVVSDGLPLYSDAHHLTIFGSVYISIIFDPLFGELSENR